MSYDADQGGGLAADVPGVILTDGAASASSARPAAVVSAGSPAHTAGSWVELDASLSDDVSGITILPGSKILSGNPSSFLVDIGIGAAAAETVWAQIQTGYNDTTAAHAGIYVPGHIAAGTRVALRARSVQASGSQTFAYYFHAAPTPVTLGAPVTYGANTATSRGVTLTAPGSLNTKGAWTEITAATAADLVALSVQIGLNGASSTGTGQCLVDIGTGAAAAETVLIPDLALDTISYPYFTRKFPAAHAVTVPSGTRLSARFARSNVFSALDLHLIGTPAA